MIARHRLRACSRSRTTACTRGSARRRASVDFLPFPDLDEACARALRQIEESPLLPDSFGVDRVRLRASRRGKLDPVELGEAPRAGAVERDLGRRAASAFETGQFAFAPRPPRRSASASRPGTRPRPSSAIFVIPSPGWKVTVAVVASSSGAWPACARPCESAIEKHDGVRGGDQLLGARQLPPASSARAAQLTACCRSRRVASRRSCPRPPSGSRASDLCAPIGRHRCSLLERRVDLNRRAPERLSRRENGQPASAVGRPRGRTPRVDRGARRRTSAASATISCEPSRSSIAHRDRDLEPLRRRLRARQLGRERHREAAGVRGREQLLRARLASRVGDARRLGVGERRERAGRRRSGSPEPFARRALPRPRARCARSSALGHDLDALAPRGGAGPRARAPPAARGSRPRAGRASARASSAAAARARARAASSATRLSGACRRSGSARRRSRRSAAAAGSGVTISQYQAGRPKNAKTKIAITITQSRNAVPQRGWIRLKRCTRLRASAPRRPRRR